MSAGVDYLLTGLGVIVMLPVTVLLIQVAGALVARPSAPVKSGRRPRIAVLVPAHNEAGGVAATLSSAAPQLVPGDCLVVVADNCSDATAGIAAARGAEVATRHDPDRRGKGYALDFGIRYLEKAGREQPEVLIVVDADCTLGPGALDSLARQCLSSGRPAQAVYLMQAHPRQGAAAAAIAVFAWTVRNLVRPLGAHRLGLPCQLMGSGMALPWSSVRSMQLAGGHIVEDMKLGMEFALAGMPPLFCPGATVLSRFPGDEEGATSQRMRWEHGHLAMIVVHVPRLLSDALIRRSAGALALALDLCVPPLALLMLLIAGLLALCLLHALLNASILPFLVAGFAAVMFALAVGLAWLRFGREVLPPGSLYLIVRYVWRKLPLYASFLADRQTAWKRAKRDGE